MPRLLLRAHKSPFSTPSAGQVLSRNLIGDNVGNLIFSYAVQRTLSVPGTSVDVARLNRARSLSPDEIDERYDHLVIPLANAFRNRFLPNLDAMTETIEKLSIPVTVVGVGVQSAVGERVKAPKRVGEAVRRFVGAVLDRSPSIGVRGEWTAEYLGRLGFGEEHVEVIGCPSMFLHGDRLPLRRTRSLKASGPIAFNLSPYLEQMAPVVENQVARYPGLVYFGQDIRTLQLLLEGRTDAVVDDSRLPVHAEHPLIAQGRTRFPLDPSTWMDSLAAFPFSYGTRIHGNIAALLAGTPAYVLTHDARTLELARYHRIPHRRIDVAFDLAEVDPLALHAEADWKALEDGHAERFERYARFLHAHDLAHVFDPGQSAGAAAFDRRVARRAYARPVGEPLQGVPRPRDLSDRLVQQIRRRLARPVRRRG